MAGFGNAHGSLAGGFIQEVDCGGLSRSLANERYNATISFSHSHKVPYFDTLICTRFERLSASGP
jgi:hypothetical protein